MPRARLLLVAAGATGPWQDLPPKCVSTRSGPIKSTRQAHTSTPACPHCTQAPSSAATSTDSSSSAGAGPRATQIQDLVRLLHESEDPLWELVRFEAAMSAAQDEEVHRLCALRLLEERDTMITRLIL